MPIYASWRLRGTAAEPTKVTDLPGKGDELNHHWTKSLFVSADGTHLYVGVGSNSNIGENGMQAEHMRAAILEVYPANGAILVYASGLRNPVGMDWNPQTEDVAALKARLTAGLEAYRNDYAAYYTRCRHASSPAMRDPNPTVVLIPGLGLIAWGKDKSESRVTAEFYNCAVEVMRGAEAIDEYVALPQQEACRSPHHVIVYTGNVMLIKRPRLGPQ